jgi:hypothetical protein
MASDISSALCMSPCTFIQALFLLQIFVTTGATVTVLFPRSNKTPKPVTIWNVRINTSLRTKKNNKRLCRVSSPNDRRQKSVLTEDDWYRCLQAFNRRLSVSWKSEHVSKHGEIERHSESKERLCEACVLHHGVHNFQSSLTTRLATSLETEASPVSGTNQMFGDRDFHIPMTYCRPYSHWQGIGNYTYDHLLHIHFRWSTFHDPTDIYDSWHHYADIPVPFSWRYPTHLSYE